MEVNAKLNGVMEEIREDERLTGRFIMDPLSTLRDMGLETERLYVAVHSRVPSAPGKPDQMVAVTHEWLNVPLEPLAVQVCVSVGFIVGVSVGGDV